MGEKRLIFVFCACGDGGWRGARCQTHGVPVQKRKFCTGRMFVPFLGGKCDVFYVESVKNAVFFPCQCIFYRYRPIPIKVNIDKKIDRDFKVRLIGPRDSILFVCHDINTCQMGVLSSRLLEGIFLRFFLQYMVLLSGHVIG